MKPTFYTERGSVEGRENSAEEMDRLKDTLSGKKKRHTIGVTDGRVFDEALAEEGAKGSPAMSRASPNSPAVGRSGLSSPAVSRAGGSAVSSPSPSRTDSKGKFATMMGKAKDKLAESLRSTPSPSMSRRETDSSPSHHNDFDAAAGEDVPVPQLNFAHYGQKPSGPNDDDGEGSEEEKVEAVVVKPVAEPPYVEDDPSLTVLIIAKATYDYGAQEATEMEMAAGDRIAVYSFEPDRWGKGRNLRTKQRGEFPCNRTNVAEVARLAPPVLAKKPGSPGVNTSGSMASPQVQRVHVAAGSPVVGSPQVQRLAFFDSLNQDIAYQQQKQARGGAPEMVEVFVDEEPPRQHASAPPSISVTPEPSATLPRLSVGEFATGTNDSSHLPSAARPASTPPAIKPEQHQQHQHQQLRKAPAVPNAHPPQTSPGRRPLPPGPQTHTKGSASPIVGSPQVQRLAFFDNLNKDIAQQERRKSVTSPSGPTIQKIVASEEDYPMDERGTE